MISVALSGVMAIPFLWVLPLSIYLLTFILCLGYYITPVLIGGASDQLISNFIANYVNAELNWEMAAALSFVLLASTLGLYVTLTRYLGLDLFRMG